MAKKKVRTSNQEAREMARQLRIGGEILFPSRKGVNKVKAVLTDAYSDLYMTEREMDEELSAVSLRILNALKEIR